MIYKLFHKGDAVTTGGITSGSALFSNEASPATPYSTYSNNPYDFVLGVKSRLSSSANQGFSIFSAEATPADRLRIFSNNGGTTIIESQLKPVLFKDRDYAYGGFLSFYPSVSGSLQTTVVSDEQATTPPYVPNLNVRFLSLVRNNNSGTTEPTQFRAIVGYNDRTYTGSSNNLHGVIGICSGVNTNTKN